MRPKQFVKAAPSVKISNNSTKLAGGFGFSNGCAELTLKKPPPSPLKSLMASWEATGPRAIVRGPVASQEAIKLLSGDGGGFFNANSAHPFENPTALAGLMEMLLIFLIGTALTNTFGRMVGDERQGWALFAVMAVMFLAGAAAIYASEAAPNRAFDPLPSRPVGGRSPIRRQYGRQGGALRRRPVGAVRHRQHRVVGRRGGFHA